MRLSAPTNRTFSIAAVLLVAGIAAHLGYLGDLLSSSQEFWLTAAGGLLLAIGAMFRKL